MSPALWHYYGCAMVIGAVVGFFSGMLGKGGSAVTTPVLRVFLDTPSYFALASPLPATLPTALAASWAYRGHDLVHWRVVWVVCLWGIPATIFGSWVSRWTGGHFLMILTAVFVMTLGAMMLWNLEAVAADDEDGERELRMNRLPVIALGVSFLSGLLANTGGIMYAPLFIQVVRLKTKQALATSLVVSAILAIPGTLTHWYLGHIDWLLAAALSVGTIPCSYLGARVALRLRSTTLARVYGFALLLFGIYDMTQTEGIGLQSARLMALFSGNGFFRRVK